MKILLCIKIHNYINEYFNFADLSKSRNNKIDLNKIVNFVYNIKRKHSLYIVIVAKCKKY